MEEVGMVYASIRNVRKIVAAIIANKIASHQERNSLFFFFSLFFLFFQKV